MTFGIYIHLPFCQGKCDYCSFYSIPKPANVDDENELFDAYLDALLKDIYSRNNFKGEVVDTIYFGGGTPPLFGTARIQKLLKAIFNCFEVAQKVEISIECNPSDLEEDKLLQLIELGINRVTVGIQTFHEHLRNQIGRVPKGPNEKSLLKFMEIPNIVHGIDLMCGIIGSTEKELMNDIALATSLKAEHISVYLLTIENKTPLALRCCDDDNFQKFQRRQLELVMDILPQAGYNHYEISNYCLPGFYSRHNMKYWKFQPYLGFGSGAHSFTGSKRFYNRQTVYEYVVHPQWEEDVRTDKSAMVEFFLTAFRLIEGFSERMFIEVFNTEIPLQVKDRIQLLQEKKLVIANEKDGDMYYRLSKEGIIFSDYVIYQCVEPLL